MSDREHISGRACHEEFREEHDIDERDEYPERLERKRLVREVSLERSSEGLILFSDILEMRPEGERVLLSEDDPYDVPDIRRDGPGSGIERLRSGYPFQEARNDMAIVDEEPCCKQYEEEDSHEEEYHGEGIESSVYYGRYVGESENRGDPGSGDGHDIRVSFRYDHPEEGDMGEKQDNPLDFGSSGELEVSTFPGKEPIVFHILFRFVFLSLVDPTDDEERECREEGDIDAVVDGYPYDRDGIGEERAQEVGIEEVGDEKEHMSFCRSLRMLADEGIREIRIVLRKQKEPSEEEIGNGGVVPDFLRDHGDMGRRIMYILL